MFKSILNKLIQSRNSAFVLDKDISNSDAFIILVELIIGFSRSFLFLRINPSKRCICGSSVKLKHRRLLTLGSSIRLGSNVVLDSLGKNGIKIGNAVSIGDYTKLVVSSDYSNFGDGITIGKAVGIGEFSRIGGSGGVFIGKNTIIGQYFSCHPENHIFNDRDKPIKYQGTTRAPIFIGENCWIGAKVTILAGSKIGHNSVIAAGAVVSGEFPSYSVIGGVPAKIIREVA